MCHQVERSVATMCHQNFVLPLCVRLFKQTPEAFSSVVMAPVAVEIFKHGIRDFAMMVAKFDRLDHILLGEEVHVVSMQLVR